MTDHEADHEPDTGPDTDPGGFILAGVQECPGCGVAVLAGLGEEVTGCADHGG